MLQNAHLLAKIGADTAENERKFAENMRERASAPANLLLRALAGGPRGQRGGCSARLSV